jgi:tRNA threonylcarbamoyladenosine biosynthesis protein TsaB
MLILAVDQSSALCGLALLEDGRPLAEDTWPGDRSRGQDLYARLPRLLERGGRALTAVDAFAVGLGPGAFSALRTSLSYFQALALPDPKPVIGVESAAAMAWDAWRETAQAPVAVVGDARRERLWAARFDPSTADGMPVRADYVLLKVEELAAFLAPARVAVTPHWERIGGLLRANAHAGLRVVEGSRSPAASSVGELAALRMQAGVAASAPSAPLTPVYLFPPVSVAPRFPAAGMA